MSERTLWPLLITKQCIFLRLPAPFKKPWISLTSSISDKMNLSVGSLFFCLTICGTLASNSEIAKRKDEVENLNNMRDKKRKYFACIKRKVYQRKLFLYSSFFLVFRGDVSK